MNMSHGNRHLSWIDCMNTSKGMSDKDLRKVGFTTGVTVVLIFVLLLLGSLMVFLKA